MKNNLFLLLCVVFCGKAYALPQDWPCFGIQVEKYKTVSDADGIFEYTYKGEKDGYVLNINLSGFSDFPTSFADCGNSGCFGIITETATGRTEHLRFFCEEYNDDYTKVTCYAGLGEEVIFEKEDDKNYVVHYCSDNSQKTLRFNLNDCDKCYCKMYWYEGNIKDTTGSYGMACKKEENKAHCFTNYGYESWRNFQNKVDDFQNCIGLDF